MEKKHTTYILSIFTENPPLLVYNPSNYPTWHKHAAFHYMKKKFLNIPMNILITAQKSTQLKYIPHENS